MAVLESAIFWIEIAAASEIIALSPLKDNSIIQLVFHAIESLKPAHQSRQTLTMVSGYFSSTVALMPNVSNVGHSDVNFMQLFQRS